MKKGGRIKRKWRRLRKKVKKREMEKVKKKGRIKRKWRRLREKVGLRENGEG